MTIRKRIFQTDIKKLDEIRIFDVYIKRLRLMC